ncbi:HSF-DOMAIN domain-containing protein [Mycena kentingensis (nom. inval.)]|nr:HSF-DOMAIN domain-containing protein [Mycena kentingensis (nom. inval.)]
MHRSNSSLSLNLAHLSVTSPTNLSPIGPPSGALSPVTPISPAAYGNHHLHPYQYNPDTEAAKRSFSADPSPISRTHTPSIATPALRITTDPETLSPRPLSPVSANPTSAGYEDMDMGLSVAYDGGSPVDGSSGSGDDSKSIPVPSMLPMVSKPMATNNFVTKLYQMINDPKSSHFISWTDLGTSFVVSNVGEFSRSILGSHFKHNNVCISSFHPRSTTNRIQKFSSFVRQLNMYGFHKINRTPRAQRTTSDAQTWEFSHHKFLRGRADLLDEIKRKALEPDPGLKHRVELPGEVAAQLAAMREENQRMWDQLNVERRRADKLVSVVSRLWDVVAQRLGPESVPAFPMELVEPNIFVTSPRGYQASSPANDYSHPPPAHPPHHGHNHALSRQQSLQHMSSMPASPSSMSMEIFEDSEPRKRPRMMSSDEVVQQQHPHQQYAGVNGSPHPHHAGSVDSLSPPKPRTNRARSDSAPLNYMAAVPGSAGAAPNQLGPWGTGPGPTATTGRPRSGSGYATRGMPSIGMGMGRVQPGGAPSR